MKNTLHTDNTCNLRATNINESQSLQTYYNVLTSTLNEENVKYITLGDDLITQQSKQITIGGTRRSYEKQQLIKEYKKLMKQYNSK